MPPSNSPKSRPSRPSRPPAPSMPLFDALDQTHRQVLSTLDQLAQLAEQLDANRGGDDSARGLAREICQFFDGTAREHHRAEEELVFPNLLDSGNAELVQHVQRLQQDHGWLEEDWLELSPQLQAISQGQHWVDPDMLRSGIAVFTALYREHIALEETIVYPAGRSSQR